MDLKTEIFNYLKTHKLMSLATVGESGPWLCNVFYVADDNLDVYFLSYPLSRHAVEISKNENVSIAIADISQKILDKKTGIQMQGVAHILEQGSEHVKAMELWLNSVIDNKDEKQMELARARFTSGAIFKFQPHLVRFLHEELFGENGIKELKLGY